MFYRIDSIDFSKSPKDIFENAKEKRIMSYIVISTSKLLIFCFLFRNIINLHTVSTLRIATSL